ncbi:hypothetical protein [Streptomyces sp. NPDC048659]|uniref:hypothetical protein n=1 Tax=Streptomyces sp. NPDC048659 TaxID=3155489 RepID=UPI00341E740A
MTPRLRDWLLTGRTVAMCPAGTWWDAVRGRRSLGLAVLGTLGERNGAVIEDLGSNSLVWSPSRAAAWRSLSHSAALSGERHF